MMKYLYAHLAVAFLAYLQLTDATCSYSKATGYFGGWDIKSYTDISVEGCKHECDVDPNCKSFHYRTRYCYLKKKSMTPNRYSYKNYAWYRMYTKQPAGCSGTAIQSRCQFTRETGNCNGRDLRSFSRISLDGCKIECSNRLDCHSFHYTGTTCYLKYHVCTNAQLASKGSANTNQWVKDKNCPSYPGHTCDYTERLAAHCSGHVIQTLSKVTIETCKTQCNFKEDCFGISYRTTDEICWLQNYVCKENQFVYKGNPIYNHYTKGDCQKGSPVKCKFSQRRVGMCNGFDLVSLAGVSLAACQMECTQRPACKSIHIRQKTCWLKNKKCTDNELLYKKQTLYMTYDKPDSCNSGKKCAFSKQYAYCASGVAFKTLSRVSIGACFTECSLSRRCVGFNYRTKTCWLQSTTCTGAKLLYKGNRYYKYYTKNDRLCSRPPEKQCKFKFEYGNCNGRDIKSYGKVTRSFCEKMCSDMPDCLSFLWNTARTCYLKRHICTQKELASKKSFNTAQYSKPAGCFPRIEKTCQYQKRHPAHCGGHVLQTLTKVEPETCQIECNNEPDCLGISYRHSDQICWLQNYVCKPNQFVYKNNPDYTHYTKKENCKRGTGVSCRYKLAYHDCQGHDILILRSVSLATCEMECSRRGSCKNFVYYNEGCYLKDYNCPPKEYWAKRTGDRYYKTFTKQGDCGQGATCSFTRKIGYCAGHVIKTLSSTTLEACYAECSAVRHCLGFHYRSKICWLQNYVCPDNKLLYKDQRLYKQFTKKDMDCSASPARTCEYPKTYGNCNGHDIRSYAKVSLQFCKTACTHLIDCLAFHYNYARTCYLKNYICRDNQLAGKGTPLSANFVKPFSCGPGLGLSCKYKMRNAECPGRQIKYLPKVDKSTCETECNNNRDCAAFQYRIGNCWLKNYDCKENQLTKKGDGNYHLYTKGECSPAKSEACEFGLATGVCPGNDIMTMSAITLPTCKMECSRRPECKALQYRVTSCWLKRVKCSDAKLKYKGNRYYNQYRKTGECKVNRGPVCKFSFRQGLCNGHDIRSYTDISLTACLDQCSVNKQCLGVHYRTRTCWLKNYRCKDAQLLYKQLPLYKQYDKTNLNCGTPPGDQCQFTTERGFCSGHDIKIHYYISIEACRTDCSRRIDCLSFFYNHKAHHCYMKNFICPTNKLYYKNNALYNQNVKSPSCKIIPRSRDYPSKTCTYRKRPATLCSGHVHQTITKVQPETCKTACDLKIDCAGFSYRHSDNLCWLQNYACKDNQLAYKGNKNHDSYVKQGCKRGSNVKCQFRRTFGTCGHYSYNWRIGILSNVSPATCMQECSQRPECSNFQMRKNVCWLSDYHCRKSEYTAVGNKLQNNFIKTGQCTKGIPCTYSVRYGNCPGRIIKTLSYLSLQGCKAECSRRHDCQGFQSRSIYCWLQNYVCADSKLQYRGNRLYKQYTKNNRHCSIPPEKMCKFKFTQANCNGHNYRTYAGVSLQTCKIECAQQMNCLGFQYTYTRYCYLKNFDCTDRQLAQRGKTGASYYVRSDSCRPLGFVCQYTHRNAECAGHVIKSMTKVDLETCRSECSNNRDCLAFQYRVGYCYLKNYDCKENQLSYKGNGNYHLYTKKNTECPRAKSPICDFERVHGDCTKNMRNIWTMAAISLRTCETECSKRRECRSLQYRNRYCWLKDHICSDVELTVKGNRYYNQFRKTAACKPPALAICKYTRRYGYCAGHDIKSFSGITLETCKAECSQRKDCLLIHYRSRSCWLKNYVCPFNKIAYKGNRLYKEFVKDNKDCGRAPAGPCSFKAEERGSCNGHAIGTYSGMSRVGCQIECSKRVDCWNYHYYSPSKTCYLKNYICSTRQLIYKTNRYYNQNVKPDSCNPLGKVCDYSLEIGDCGGHDIKHMTDVDLDTCRTQCNNDHDCLGFQYNARHCYIKNYDCKITQLRYRGDHNYHQYTKKSCRKGRGNVCPFTRRFGQCKGHALKTLSSVYLPTCKMECSRRGRCTGAYYQKPHCYLKNHVCSDSKLAYKGYRYMQQFTKSSTCPPNEGKICGYTERRGECYAHNILTLTDVGINTCRAQCATSPACKGFHYRSRRCWFKNYKCYAKTPLKYTSYMHYRQFDKQMPCHKSPAQVCKFEKVDGACNGYDIKRLDRVTLEACMAECTDRYNCFSFYYTGVYCYLKKHICTGTQLRSKNIKNRQYNRATSCGRVKGKLCKFNTRAGYCNRYNFKTYNKMSLLACQIECSNRLDCISYMYAKSIKRCFLKNNLCKDHEISLRTSKDYSIGVKTNNCGKVPVHKCSYNRRFGNCGGHDKLILYDVHMDTCLAQCQKRDDCHTVVYYNKNCYMKNYVCKSTQISSKNDENFWLFTKEQKCVPPVPCKCRFEGDPHYYTFDGQRIDFQGICKYTAAATKDENDPCSFKIETKHEYRGSHAVSYVRIVDLKMFGHVIRLQKGNVAYADGKRITMPQYNLFGKFDVTFAGGYMTAAARKCKVSIRYNGNYMASLIAPGQFRGKMYGICGDCNGHNWVTKEGKTVRNAWTVGNSYQVGDDSDVPAKNCKTKEPEIKCHEPLKSLVKTNKYCGYFKNVKGPFGSCIRGNKAGHLTRFKGCEYDVCAFSGNRDKAKKQACNALASFAVKCAARGYKVKPWRTTNFCPKHCGPGKRYSQRANSCPNTCANPVGNFLCNKPPVEGCECKPGFVQSGTACIPRSNCKAKPGPPCLKKVDVVFVMDSSGSVKATNFKKMKAFVINVVGSLGKIGPNHAQVGVVRYSTGASEIIRLNQYKSTATLEGAIAKIPYVKGWTYTAKAFHLTRVQAMAAAHGRRANVESMVIVLTDGKATDSANLGKEADALRQHAKRIVAVGIGRGVDEKELELMAGGKENVLKASFGDLSSKIKGVLAKACNCPIGFRVRNFKCTFASCPEGYQQQRDGTKMSCKKRKCQRGFIFTHGKCTYRACPGGYIALYINGKVARCWNNRGKPCPHNYHVKTVGGKKVCARNLVPACRPGSKASTVNGKRVCTVPTSGGCPRRSVERFVGAKRICTKDKPKTCHKGTKMATVGGKKVCYKGTGCPAGYTRGVGKCVFVKCPRGYIRKGHQCRKRRVHSCPPGTTQGRIGFAYVCLKRKGRPCPKGSVQALFGHKKVCYKYPHPFRCHGGFIQIGHRCVRQQFKCPKGTTSITLHGHRTCSKSAPKCPKGYIQSKRGNNHLCTRPGFRCPVGYRKEGRHCVRIVPPGHGCRAGTIRFIWKGQVFCIRGPVPGRRPPCPSGKKILVLMGRRICSRGPGPKGCPPGTFKLEFNGKKWCLRGPGPKPGNCAAGLSKIVWQGHTYCFRLHIPNTRCPAGTVKSKVGTHEICAKKPPAGKKCPAGTFTLRFGKSVFCIRGPAKKPTKPVKPPPKQKCLPGLIRIVWNGLVYCMKGAVPNKKCPKGRKRVKVGNNQICAKEPKTASCPAGTSSLVIMGMKFCFRVPGPAPAPPLTCPKGKVKVTFNGHSLCVKKPSPTKPCPKGTKRIPMGGQESCVKPPVAGKCPPGNLRIVHKYVAYCLPLAMPQPGTCRYGQIRLVFMGHTYCLNAGAPNKACPSGQKKQKIKGKYFCMKTPTGGKCPAGQATIRWNSLMFCVNLPYGPGANPSPIKLSCPKGTTQRTFGTRAFCIPPPGTDGNCAANTQSFDFGHSSGCILPPGPAPQPMQAHCPRGMQAMGFGTALFCVSATGPSGCPKGTKKYSFLGMEFCAPAPVGGKCSQAGYKVYDLGGLKVCGRGQLPAGPYCPQREMVSIKFGSQDYCVLKTVKGHCTHGLNKLEYKGQFVCIQIPGKVPAIGCPPGSDGMVYGGIPFCSIVFTGSCPAGTTRATLNKLDLCLIDYATGTHIKLGGLQCPAGSNKKVIGGITFCMQNYPASGCPAHSSEIKIKGGHFCYFAPGPGGTGTVGCPPHSITAEIQGKEYCLPYALGGRCPAGFKRDAFHGKLVCYDLKVFTCPKRHHLTNGVCEETKCPGNTEEGEVGGQRVCYSKYTGKCPTGYSKIMMNKQEVCFRSYSYFTIVCSNMDHSKVYNIGQTFEDGCTTYKCTMQGAKSIAEKCPATDGSCHKPGETFPCPYGEKCSCEIKDGYVQYTLPQVQTFYSKK